MARSRTHGAKIVHSMMPREGIARCFLVVFLAAAVTVGCGGLPSLEGRTASTALVDATDTISFPNQGTNSSDPSGRLITSLPADPAFMGNGGGTSNVEDKFVNTSSGIVLRVRETAGFRFPTRIMWREVK